MVERVLDQATLVREPRRLGAVLHAELAIDVREVELHRLGSDPELLRDLVVRKAAGLTDREITILRSLAQGHSNEEIAKELWVAQQTVKFHLTNIYRKLNVKNRTEATRTAYQLGLVESPLFETE